MLWDIRVLGLQRLTVLLKLELVRPLSRLLWFLIILDLLLQFYGLVALIFLLGSHVQGQNVVEIDEPLIGGVDSDLLLIWWATPITGSSSLVSIPIREVLARITLPHHTCLRCQLPLCSLISLKNVPLGPLLGCQLGCQCQRKASLVGFGWPFTHLCFSHGYL